MEAGLTTENGLLYLNGEMLGVMQADAMARKYGYMYAEQLVRALEEEKNKPLTNS